MAKAAAGGGGADSSVADQLRALGVKGVLVQMAERGQLLALAEARRAARNQQTNQLVPHGTVIGGYQQHIAHLGGPPTPVAAA